MKRLFLAAPVGPLPKIFVDEVNTRFREALTPQTPVKWTPPDHLTLHFLGKVDSTSERRLRESLAALSWNAFLLPLNGLAAFPDQTEARVLVVKSLDVPKPAGDLHGALASLLKLLQLPVENRAFVPHLTFARLPRPTPISLPTLKNSYSLFVDRICLFESHLTPTGARYEVLESWAGDLARIS